MVTLFALHSIFDSFSRQIAPFAITGLWQGIAVTFALAVGLKCSPRISAAQRFVLWLTAYLVVVVVPFAPAIVSALGARHAEGANTFAPSHALLQLDMRWPIAIASLWLLASFARAADLVVHILRLRRLWSTATPLEVQPVRTPKRAFKVCITSSVDRPSVIGFFAPRVLIPHWLLPKLSSEELEQIVLHESTHLARRDDWTNLFQKLCLVVFPLNPALWWIDRQLSREREMACDEDVVRITRAPRAYAACLASLAERGLTRRAEALSLGAWQRRSELVKRVHQILRNSGRLSPAAGRIMLGAFGCSLLVVTIELARCPQLIAFVPAAAQTARQTIVADNAQAQLGDAVYPTNPRSSLRGQSAHIVQTKAEMPTAPIIKPYARRARSRTAVVGELRAASSEPGVSTQQRLVSSPRESDAPQQFIVFTAWQQIETANPASQTVIADYDAQPSPQEATAPQDSAKKNPQSADSKSTRDGQKTRFTQLILRIVPQNSASTPSSAIPLGDGWFVIQL
ncbi:MAG TPA: M56 family metallopeptidase [Terracidiphilus sp.]|nr:M56 family metallopeptidase [Terracidiphilus sp.]